MKELKNKEVIIGLIILIVLCCISLVLILKREFPRNQADNLVVEEMSIEYADVSEHKEENIKEPAVEVVNTEDVVQTEKESISVNQNEKADSIQKLGINDDAEPGSVYYTSPKYEAYTGEEMWQLEELFFYWDDYQLEAVDDLIRLPRLRTAFTNELEGTNQFYYYGSFNGNGQPDGKGVAVYENNTYYCGEWKNGKRHGKGMWLQIFPDKTSTINGVTGVLEHSYNGQWQNDLPNGEGQEHFVYDFEKMNGSDIILNVIGSFKDGYYDGELYIITTEGVENSTDWEATAQKGVFSYYHDRYNAMKALPVWKKMRESSEMEYRWLTEKENVNWGISGLKKMN